MNQIQRYDIINDTVKNAFQFLYNSETLKRKIEGSKAMQKIDPSMNAGNERVINVVRVLCPTATSINVTTSVETEQNVASVKPSTVTNKS